MLRICKEFRFDAAHALMGYPGKCRHLHGHAYRLRVSVEGLLQEDPAQAYGGMIMDFGALKQCVQTAVIDRFDHALLLSADAPLVEELTAQYQKVVALDFQPTCEHLTLHLVRLLQDALPPQVRLHSVRLYEGPASYAEWINPAAL